MDEIRRRLHALAKKGPKAVKPWRYPPELANDLSTWRTPEGCHVWEEGGRIHLTGPGQVCSQAPESRSGPERGTETYLRGFISDRNPPIGRRNVLPEREKVVRMAKIKIENVVASTSLGGELDLQAIALALGGAEYEPEQFPGLIYRLKEPKTATLLFRSGKVVCTGAKSLDHVKTAIDTVAKQIEAAGIPIKKDPVIEVQNIVASSDLGTEINLNAIAISLGLEKVEYEPEQFPGLVYRIDEPKVVVLLFGSGKLVCTGARKPSDVEQAVEKITQELKAAGLLR